MYAVRSNRLCSIGLQSRRVPALRLSPVDPYLQLTATHPAWEEVLPSELVAHLDRQKPFAP